MIKKLYVFDTNSEITVFLPRLLSSRAVSFPIPVFAPVITATLPSSRIVLVQRGPWNQRGILVHVQQLTEQTVTASGASYSAGTIYTTEVTRSALVRLL